MFSSLDGVDLVGASNRIAHACGQEFCQNVNSVRSAGADAVNSLPMDTSQGRGIGG